MEHGTDALGKHLYITQRTTEAGKCTKSLQDA